MAQPGGLNRLPHLIGAKIRLTSEEGDYSGVVATVSLKASKVVLEKVKSSGDGKEVSLPGVLSFSLDEIIKYECLDLPEPPLPSKAKTNPSQVLPIKSSPTASSRSPQVFSTSISKALTSNSSSSRKETSTSVSCASESAENVEKIPGNGEDTPEDLENTLESFEEEENVESLLDLCYTFKQHQHEIPGKQRPNRFAVVDFIGDIFHEAIELIKNNSIIGCGFDGISLGRYGQIDWIEVATKDLIVLFDMLSMDPREAFNSGLRDILESSSILKVVHDCRQISDLLYHQYEIYLVNVFDTQVADVMIQRSTRYGRIPRYVRNLASCLKDYLALTTEQVAFYEVRKVSLEHDNEIWHKRPLPPFLLESAAANVRYLRELRSATFEKMLEEFTFGVDLFLSAVRDAQRDDSIDHHGELLPHDFFQLDYPTMVRLRNTNGIHKESPEANTSQLLDKQFSECYNLQSKLSEIPKNENDDLLTQTMPNPISPILDQEINTYTENSVKDDNFDDMPALEEIPCGLEEEEEGLGLSLEQPEKNQERLDEVRSSIVSSASSLTKKSKSESIYEKLSREIESCFTSKKSTSDLVKSEQGVNQFEAYNCHSSQHSLASEFSDRSSSLSSDFQNRGSAGTVLAAPRLQSLSNTRVSGLSNKKTRRPHLNIPPAGYYSAAKQKA